MKLQSRLLRCLYALRTMPGSRRLPGRQDAGLGLWVRDRVIPRGTVLDRPSPGDSGPGAPGRLLCSPLHPLPHAAFWLLPHSPYSKGIFSEWLSQEKPHPAQNQMGAPAQIFCICKTKGNRNLSISDGIWGASCEEGPQESPSWITAPPPAPGAACTSSSDGCGCLWPPLATVRCVLPVGGRPVKQPGGLGSGPRPALLYYLWEWWPANGQKPFRKLENCLQTLSIKIKTTCCILRGEGAGDCAWRLRAVSVSSSCSLP